MNRRILRTLVVLVSLLGAVASAGASGLTTQASAAIEEDVRPIQEGTPVSDGGRAIVLGAELTVNDALYGIRAPYSSRPGTVSPDSPDVAISGNVVLRADGTVAQAESSYTSLQEAPDGLRYVAVAGEYDTAFGLRSDGSVAALTNRPDLADWAQAQLPPEDGVYTRIAFGSDLYSLREDGVIVTETDAMCPDSWKPPAGLRYTAISAAYQTWAAVRSDGALITCGYRASDREKLQGDLPGLLIAEVHADELGYVGIDAAATYVLTVRPDGTIESVAGSSPELPLVPAGRKAVSLAAGLSTTAAVLDDGSLVWAGTPLDLTSMPEGTDRFAAVTADRYGFIRAIWKHELVDVDLTARSVGDVAFGSPGVVEVTVSSPGGFVPDGWICVRGRGCPAQVTNDQRTAIVTLSPAESEGDHAYDLRMVSSLTSAASTTATVRVLPRRSIGLAIDGPREWTVLDTGVRFDVELVLAEDQEFKDVKLYEEGRIDLFADCGPPEERSRLIGRAEVRAPDLEYPLGINTENCPAGEFEVRARFIPAPGVDAAEVEVSFGMVRVRTEVRIFNDYDEMTYDRDHLHQIDVRSQPDQIFHAGTVEVRWMGRVVGTQRIATESYHHVSLDGSLLMPGTGQLEVDYISEDGLAYGSDSDRITIAEGRYDGRPNPTIPDTLRVGQTVKVATVSPPAGTKVSYEWRLVGGLPGTPDETVAGATGATWTVPASALDKQVWVHVTWSREHYRTVTQFAATLGPVLPGAFTAPLPSISGTAKVGKVLRATRGTWTPAPTSVTYVWKAGTSTLKSGSAAWLTVPAAARGKRITVTVVGRRAGYSTRSVTSSATAVTLAGTFVASRPRIVGTARVGVVLRAERGTWTPAPTSVRYVWKVGGKTYRTTESNRLRIPASARGKRITVTVVGGRSGYSTKRVTSYRTGVVR